MIRRRARTEQTTARMMVVRLEVVAGVGLAVDEVAAASRLWVPDEVDAISLIAVVKSVPLTLVVVLEEVEAASRLWVDEVDAVSWLGEVDDVSLLVVAGNGPLTLVVVSENVPCSTTSMSTTAQIPPGATLMTRVWSVFAKPRASQRTLDSTLAGP